MVIQTRIGRRQLLRDAGVATAAAVLAAGPAGLMAASQPAAALADDDMGQGVEGGWHVTVQVEATPTPPAYDALYLFGRGGAFTRVDGRSATKFSTGAGTWKRHGSEILFDYLLFTFNAGTGARTGTITVPSVARVSGDTITGTFTATGVATDANGNAVDPPVGLPGFPKHGTFSGTRIDAVG